MKDFYAFKSTLTEEMMATVMNKINDLKLEIPWPITPDNFNELAGLLTVANTTVVLELLQMYHDWLYSDREEV